MATGFVQHHTGRPSVGNISVARQSNMSYNLDDLRASIARAGARGSGMSNFKMMEPVTRRGLDSISSSPAGFPALGPAPCKPGRRHSRRQASSKKGGAAVPVTAAAVAAASKAAAAGGIASAWVWGQGAPKVPAVDAGSAQGTVDQEQQQGLQQPHGEPEQCDNAGHVAGNKKPSDMHRMFAGSSSSSFESTCSTEALTVSNTSSPKDANFDDPFLNHLSDFSLRFPEPPTRPPVASPPSSSSRALAISGWGKHITSSIPSVQLLLPPSWRRRLRANGTNNKRCRKSTARWIARSKATSSMSESSLLARALSMNDTVSSQPYNRRGKETAGAVVDAAGAAAETPVCHKSAPTPRLAEMTELTEEQSPSPVGVSRAEADQGKDQQDQEQVQKQQEGQQQEQQQQQQQQKEDEEMERLQEQLERQLQQLLLANKEETEPQPQPQLQQPQQQQVDLEQPREDQPRSVDAPPSALPTPFRFGDRAQLQQSPPPAPLWTAPRPPLSRERQRQQLSNATAMLAARHSSNRRYYFGSSSGSSTPRGQGSSRCSSRCSSSLSRSSSGTKENRLASWSTTPGLSSPSPTSPAYKLINRLASSSSSIFEEDGDDSKKTKFLNPYVRLPVRAPRPKAVAAPSAPPAGPSGSAAAAEPVLRGPPRQTPSGTWVWGGRSPRASSAATCTEQQQQVQQQQQQQQQQRKNMFGMDAGGDSFMSNRRRRRAGLTALHVEINRRDARAFGDNRRRMKSGDSGIWLPSPDIWSSARRPTPLNGELFTAW
ncbi:unnamed protein product [Scytosiphon promiscuus]